MSYDLAFVRRDDPESYRPLRASPRLRERLLAAMTDPDDAFEDPDGGYQLTDLSNTIQVSYSDDGVGMSVGWGGEGDERIEALYRLAAIIEEETGLAGYDTQIGQFINAAEPGTPSEAYRYGAAVTNALAKQYDQAAQAVSRRPRCWRRGRQ